LVRPRGGAVRGIGSESFRTGSATEIAFARPPRPLQDRSGIESESFRTGFVTEIAFARPPRPPWAGRPDPVAGPGTSRVTSGEGTTGAPPNRAVRPLIGTPGVPFDGGRAESRLMSGAQPKFVTRYVPKPRQPAASARSHCGPQTAHHPVRRVGRPRPDRAFRGGSASRRAPTHPSRP
jgi:hypothetical protein